MHHVGRLVIAPLVHADGYEFDVDEVSLTTHFD